MKAVWGKVGLAAQIVQVYFGLAQATLGPGVSGHARSGSAG